MFVCLLFVCLSVCLVLVVLVVAVLFVCMYVCMFVGLSVCLRAFMLVCIFVFNNDLHSAAIHLQYLNLNNNRLLELPLVVFSLTNLEELYVDFNSVCWICLLFGSSVCLSF